MTRKRLCETAYVPPRLFDRCKEEKKTKKKPPSKKKQKYFTKINGPLSCKSMQEQYKTLSKFSQYILCK